MEEEVVAAVAPFHQARAGGKRFLHAEYPRQVGIILVAVENRDRRRGELLGCRKTLSPLWRYLQTKLSRQESGEPPSPRSQNFLQASMKVWRQFAGQSGKDFFPETEAGPIHILVHSEESENIAKQFFGRMEDRLVEADINLLSGKNGEPA